MPTGRIRALLTLIVIAVVVTKLGFQLPLDSTGIETLLIAFVGLLHQSPKLDPTSSAKTLNHWLVIRWSTIKRIRPL